MKHSSRFLMVFATIAFVFSSCLPIEDVFDESLLIGTWVSGTDHFRYDADYKGVSWDTSEDVKESEGQAFKWELKMSTLSQSHLMVIGSYETPRIYTITKLTATTLEYKDDFNKYVFTKL